VTRTAAVAAVLGLGGCIPLPIPNTIEVSPAIRGRVVHEDGLPHRGGQVGIADRRGRCGAPVASASVDSGGWFAIPQVMHRQKVLWLSLMHTPPGLMGYTLCVTPPSGDATPVAVPVFGYAGSDEVECLTWSFDDRPRVECGTLVDPGLTVTGGEWSSGQLAGYYRVILAPDPYRFASTFGYIQWVIPGPPGGADHVHATLWLPSRGREWFIEPPTLVQRDGRWNLEGPIRRPGGLRERWTMRFELGGPGEFWRHSDGR
jgi:hypothetical protein